MSAARGWVSNRGGGYRVFCVWGLRGAPVSLGMGIVVGCLWPVWVVGRVGLCWRGYHSGFLFGGCGANVGAFFVVYDLLLLVVVLFVF